MKLFLALPEVIHSYSDITSWDLHILIHVIYFATDDKNIWKAAFLFFVLKCGHMEIMDIKV